MLVDEVKAIGLICSRATNDLCISFSKRDLRDAFAPVLCPDSAELSGKEVFLGAASKNYQKKKRMPVSNDENNKYKKKKQVKKAIGVVGIFITKENNK